MTLWAKLGAGVIAALAVVGIGIYVAMPPDCGRCGEAPPPAGSCCSGDHSDDIAPSDTGCCQGGTCCSAGPAVDTDALAACGGGLTVQPSAKVKSKPSCCGE